jgi:hypothetical protein
VHPVERARHIGQTWAQLAKGVGSGGDAETYAVHDTREVSVRSGEDVHIGPHAGPDALQFRFAEVADRPPGARIDQREDLRALVDVRSLRDRQIGNQGVERGVHLAIAEIVLRCLKRRRSCAALGGQALERRHRVARLCHLCFALLDQGIRPT